MDIRQMSKDEDQHSHSSSLNDVKSIQTTSSDTSYSSRFSTLIKYVSLIVLVLQMTSQVLLMRYATTRDQTPFFKTVAVFFNEAVKLITALVLFFITADSFKSALLGLKYCYWTNMLDTLKVGIPAFIYTIQNFLLYIGIENLDAGTYMVIYQLKILTTALFTVLLLKRRLAVLQWIALGILIAGVVIVEYSAKKTHTSSHINPMNSTLSPFNETYAFNSTELEFFSNSTDDLTFNVTQSSLEHKLMKHGNPLLGFIALLVASFLSGFAGVYFEKILKASDMSLWLRNVQLASLSLPIGFIVIMINDGREVQEKGLMQGFDWAVWGVVFIQALGGLVVAVVIKYADNILKAFATSIGIILATAASIFLFAVYPRLLFVLGAVLVISAVFVYGAFPYKPKSYSRHEDEETGSKKSEEEIDVVVDPKKSHESV